MALLKYFKKVTVLPNPEGPLSDCMPSAAISSANNEVKDLVIQECDAQTRLFPENEDSAPAIQTKRRFELLKEQQNSESQAH